jgi:hypothetical protein
MARHRSPLHIRRTRTSPAIDAVTIDQCRWPTLQHVSCPAANTSTGELHKIRLAKFNHELKLGHFPSPSSLTLATLPSMSLIPPAPFTRMNTNLGSACVARAGCGVPPQRTFQMNESGCNGCEATARLSNQSLLALAGSQKPVGTSLCGVFALTSRRPPALFGIRC